MGERYVYKVEDVTNTKLGFPAFAARTWREHYALRDMLHAALDFSKENFERACEVGCGYARMTPVLREFATEVAGFEREPHFRELARELHPEIRFPDTHDVSDLDAIDFEFDLTMTWTFLQHVHECHIKKVCKEVGGITKNFLVLCEETTHPKNTTSDLSQHICTGRMPAEYAALFPDFRLIKVEPRPIDGGALMLFVRK